MSGSSDETLKQVTEAQRIQDIEREHALRSHERMKSLEDLGVNSSHDYGLAALRALLLVNGGAAVAMLGFASTLDAFSTPVSITEIALATTKFGYGLVFTILSLGFAYLTSYVQTMHASSFKHIWEWPYLESTSRTKSLFIVTIALTIISVVAAVVALIFFWLGLASISSAFGAQ